MTPKINDIRLGDNVGSKQPLVPQTEPRKYTVVYSSTLTLVYWHLAALYGLYLSFISVKWATTIFQFFIFIIGGWGVTAGTHRLWSHRSYKAKLPLQILLMLFHSTTGQSTVLNWARDHRLHHKYTDTDADPYSSARGFFYSHIGWLLVRKHPETIKRGKKMDLSDLLDNPVLQFQTKYHLVLMSLLVFILPTMIPVYLWRETLNNAYHASLLRLVYGCHVSFSINSVAHMFGTKPYDKTISPTQNPALSLVSFGEGFHNYHHVFPFDYRVAELGNNCFNFSTNFIDFCAWIGWAYDLKHASHDMAVNRSRKTGDGTDLWGRVNEDKHGAQEAIEDLDDKVLRE